MSEVDFEAAIAAKIAASDGVETTAEEVETEPEAQVEIEAEETEEAETEEIEEQPRDDKGRYLARPDAITQKYLKSIGVSEDDFAAMPPGAQGGIKSAAHQEVLIGRQGHELHELRKIAEQIASSQPSQANIGQLGNALEENPEAVAYWAAEQGNEQILDQAMAAWTQKALDEGDAVSLRNAQRFDRDIELARLKYEFSQEVTPSIEQVREEAGKRALALARRDLQTKYPDFDQVMESVSEDEVTGLDPTMLGQLQKTDPKAALEMVYRWVATGRKAVAASDKEAEKAESLERKRQATVATSSSTPASREKSAVEQFKEMLLEPDAHSVHHGLVRE